MTDHLVALHRDHGQSPWLDNLTRNYLTGGELDRQIARGIRGLTSNPTIFQRAIQGSADYDQQFRALVAAGGTVTDHYWQLVLTDIRGALERFEPLYRVSGGGDGYVSVEVDPGLATDGPGTERAARDLHATIDRPNLMVKIPATMESLPAIETMIAEGRNVNVTLIFSLDRYQMVMDAYIRGLQRYAEDSHADLSRVASVASFFISRVDSEIDARLERIGSPEALELRGRAAVAQARLAYRQFRDTFSGPVWEALAARGAKVQRPLWASTSTKNPAYPDTMYVDELIGPDSVNTLPDATIEAFVDHGRPRRSIDVGVDEAQATWHALTAVGIDLGDVATTLEREGVASFQKSFTDLLDTLEAKADSFAS